MSAVQELLVAPAKARWPGALLGMPPGWVQESFSRGGGSVMGLSAPARLVAMFSCWMTATRLPGSGTGFSANGLMSSSLGMLGRLMPARLSAHPASASAQTSTAHDAPSLPRSSLALPFMLVPIP